MNMERLAVRLHWPILRREKWAREFPEGVCRLEVWSRATRTPIDELTDDLSGALEMWRNTSEATYALPFNVFLSARRFSDFLRTAGLQDDAHTVAEDEYVLACRTARAVREVLRGCDSERIVFVYASDESEVLETARCVCSWSEAYKAFETPYLSRLDWHDGFIIYEATHGGLSVIGTRHFVVDRCLRRLLDRAPDADG